MPPPDAVRPAFSVPPPPIQVIGRDRVLAELRAILDRESGRGALVTLWGPGGIGKTTTALAVTRDRPHVFVALARTTSDDEAVRATADALGIELGSERRPYDKLGAALAARGEPLLVLDNLEQMTDAGASFVAALRAAVRGATILVTTREALTLRGELVVPIPPLDDAAAAELLRLRSSSTELDLGIAHRIASRLEGLPLAIELAAARLELLAPTELLARLDDRLAVLRTSRRDVDPRHRALAQAIESSFVLLSPRDASGLVTLATFAGTFDANDAEALLGQGALDVLESLQRKSLVARRRGSNRFAFLEAIRAFCNERQSPADAARHRAWAARRGTELRRALDGPKAAVAMTELVQRRDDFTQALSRAAAERDPAVAPLLEALAPLAVQRGPTASYVALATAVLEGAADYPRAIAGRLFVAASQIAAADGDRRRALDLATEGATILRSESAASARDLAVAELRIGNAHFGMGSYDAARAAYGRARTACGEEDSIIKGSVAASLAVTEHAAGNVEDARAHYEEAVRTFEDGAHVALEAKVLSNLAFLELDDGDVGAARARFERARAMFEQVLDERHVAVTDGFLGNVLRASGELTQATFAYRDAVARLRRVGDRLYAEVFTMDLGIALLLDDAPSEAISHLRDALAGAQAFEDAHLAGFSSGYLVAALSMAGRSASEVAEAKARARAAARGPAARALALHELHDATSIPDARAAIANDAAAGGGGEHVRIARLLATRALARRAPPEGVLVVARATLRLPDGIVLDLESHPTPARVLDALVARRLERPGATCLTSELIALAWPGERLARGSGENRVRVAIAKLRALGLRELIEGRPGGYALSASVPVLRVTELPRADAETAD